MLILVRHGNTFAPHERAVYVGAHQDLELVEAGKRQARNLGLALAPLASRARRIWASPMRRTQTHARFTQQQCGASAAIETALALKELDYGAWAGRHKQDLVKEGWGEKIRLWESQGIYPAGAGFLPPHDVVLKTLGAWLEAMGTDALAHPGTWSLAVTHGGILRLLSTLLGQEAQASPIRSMACGNVAVVTFSSRGPEVRIWNAPPEPSLTEIVAASCCL